uniref:Uncharacterized protein n=1 Tax=viral metagenome TaxID=1070528 RepID=A0A6M3JR05_9ZZZZ
MKAQYIILATGKDKKYAYGYSKVMVNFLRFKKNKVNINSCSFYSKEEVMEKIEQLRKFWSDVPNNSYKDIFEMRVK